MIASPQSGLVPPLAWLHPDKFSTETAQTSESIRTSAISAMHGIISSIPRPGIHFVGLPYEALRTRLLSIFRIFFGNSATTSTVGPSMSKEHKQIVCVL
jgi:hypothetical protein